MSGASSLLVCQLSCFSFCQGSSNYIINIKAQMGQKAVDGICLWNHQDHLFEQSSCQCQVQRRCCCLSGGHDPVFPLETSRENDVLHKKNCSSIKSGHWAISTFCVFQYKGNQRKQNELGEHNIQDSEGFLSVLCMIMLYKIWLELHIQLINNLSSS